VEGIIALLIYICIIALAVYLVLWVLAEVGIPLPGSITRIIWVIVALVVLLLILRALPGFGVRMPRF